MLKAKGQLGQPADRVLQVERDPQYRPDTRQVKSRVKRWGRLDTEVLRVVATLLREMLLL
jgi:hypothetical protein